MIQKTFIILTLVVLSVPIFFLSVQRLSSPVSINYNEGWNAYHARQVAEGLPLYGNILTPTNYPPLSFYLMAGLSKVGIDPLISGRVIALLSLFLIAWLIHLLVRSQGGNQFAQLFSPLLFLTCFALLAYFYVGMDDPQLLGQVFMVCGLLAYLKGKKEQKYLMLASLLLMVGLLIKQNLIVVPVVIGVDVAMAKRKFLFKWLGATFLVLVGINLVIQFLSGGLYFHALLLARGFSLNKFILLQRPMTPLLLLIILGIIFLVLFIKKGRFNIFSIYFICSLVLSELFLGLSGTSINMMFDLFIGLALLLGQSLDFFSARKNFWFYLILMGIFSLSFYFFQILQYFQYYEGLRGQTKADIEFLSRYPDPTICETISLCYLAGKSFVYDPFNTTLMIKNKDPLINEQEIIEEMAGGKFNVIQLENPAEEDLADVLQTSVYSTPQERFSGNFLKALLAHYQLVRKSPSGYFYVPK